MRLKTFYANTMTEAMKMVRNTLGEEAIIVATGEEQGRGVRVTAAIEPAFELGNEGAAGADDWLQYDDEEENAAIAEELTEVLLRHAVPEEVMDHILSCATVMGFEDPGIALIAALEQLYAYRPLPIAASRKPTMMIGQPGSGKTLAVAKMAARGAMNGLRVGVISTDTMRAGGLEQLKAFTNLLRIKLEQAKDSKDLRYIVHDMQGMDQILIDTSGLNPFNHEEVRHLAKLIGAINARPVLVLPAGTDAEESGEMARIFATIGATELLPTRIDIARRLGGLLAAAQSGALAFSDFSNTSKVAEGLASLTPKTLSRLLMPGAFREKTTHPFQTTSPNAGDSSRIGPAAPTRTRTRHRKTGTRQ